MPRNPADDPARHDDDHPHDHDGCLCDHTIEPHEETPDHELPEATGGVEATKRRSRATRTTKGDA